jgi:hypothetical protein
MCTGGRLVADFVAGTSSRPGLSEDFDEHLTTTVNGLWVVWSYKLARPVGDLFIPLTGGSGYPADAAAECRRRGNGRTHDAPQARCTCGFHALSKLPELAGLSYRPGVKLLTVALHGRVLAFEWAGGGVLWRAERQTVVRVEQPTRFGLTAGVPAKRRRPGDPEGRTAAVFPVAPRDSGPVRLSLPESSPLLPVCRDDAGWCAVSGAIEPTSAPLVLV